MCYAIPLFRIAGLRSWVRFVIYDSFAKIGMSNLLSGQEGRQLLLFAASSFSKYILYHTIVYIYTYAYTYYRSSLYWEVGRNSRRGCTRRGHKWPRHMGSHMAKISPKNIPNIIAPQRAATGTTRHTIGIYIKPWPIDFNRKCVRMNNEGSKLSRQTKVVVTS